MNAFSSQISFFKNSKFFAIAGASKDRRKIGNRVLLWYQQNMAEKLSKNEIVPINPKEDEIEGVKCISALSHLPKPNETSLSIITPPTVTRKLLEEGSKLGIKHYWLQPGSENEDCLAFAEENKLEIVAGGPCILVSGATSLAKSKL